MSRRALAHRWRNDLTALLWTKPLLDLGGGE
jgi:hypothetical protein